MAWDLPPDYARTDCPLRHQLSSGAQPGRTSRMTRILIIEDDPNDAEFFQRILAQEGNTVELAASAAAGLARAQSGEFDLVLTDLDLGGPTRVEGRDLIGQLRHNDPHLPVILMTGTHTAEIAIDAIKLGAFDYFS